MNFDTARRHAVAALGVGLVSLCLVPAAGAQSAADAAPAGKVSLELNKLEQVEDACRAYLVLQNGTETTFGELELDIVLFDREDVIQRRLAVNTAPLRAGKTTVKAFEIDRQRCDAVGRVLLNDVLKCSSDEGRRDDCLGLVSVSSRAGPDFVQ